jgi:ParB family chromosome partitioning protein
MPHTAKKPAHKRKSPQSRKPDHNSVSKPNGSTNHRNGSVLANNGTHPDSSPSTPSAPTTTWQIIWIPVETIAPNPFQPRLTFDPVEMEELVASVKQRGVQQPITVRTAKPVELSTTASPDSAVSNAKAEAPFRYELVAGERRLRAAKEAKRKLVPAILRDDLSDAQAAELALLENVQRSNLSCIEEARGYRCLMLEFRLKEERLSKKVGKSVSTIKELMKLLQLPESAQTLLGEKKLTAAHGTALLALAPFEKICTSVANRSVKDKLTAASLSSTPLPNAKELKKQGLIVELDYKTKFAWRDECARCPFKAYLSSGFSSYCLKPEEWEKKQLAALEREREEEQEATAVMEQARADNSVVIEAGHLTPSSYRDLSFNDVPAGCSPQCACYREVEDPSDPTRKRPLCLDPERFRALVAAEREAEEQKRRNHHNARWEAARDKLAADLGKGELRRLTALTALPILRSMYDEYGYIENWQQGVEEIARELELPDLDTVVLADSEAEAYSALEEMLGNETHPLRPEKLLLLCVLVILANEVREAIRFIRETPGLDFVLENWQGSFPERSEEGLQQVDTSAEPSEDSQSDGYSTNESDEGSRAGRLDHSVENETENNAQSHELTIVEAG